MDIKSLYAELCTQAGDLQYKIQTMQVELTDLNARIKALNQLNHAIETAQKRPQVVKPQEETKTT